MVSDETLLNLLSTLVAARTVSFNINQPVYFFPIKYRGTLFLLTNSIIFHSEFSRDGRQLAVLIYFESGCSRFTCRIAVNVRFLLTTFKEDAGSIFPSPRRHDLHATNICSAHTELYKLNNPMVSDELWLSVGRISECLRSYDCQNEQQFSLTQIVGHRTNKQ